MKGNMSNTCMGGYCGSCHGAKGLVVGLLVLANAYWNFVADWWVFFGGLLVVGGLLKLAMPSCSHCK